MSGKNKKGGKKEEEKEEVDCVCLAQSVGAPNACPPVRKVTHPLRYYEFTQDEIKVLEECDKESFYQRCLPFSTLFASITYAAIKYGVLARSKNFGAFPKVLMAILVGHVYGRLSYVSECDKKMRQELPPDSHLGKVMRQYHLDRNPPPPEPDDGKGKGKGKAPAKGKEDPKKK